MVYLSVKNYRKKLFILALASLISFILVGCKSQDKPINKTRADVLIENSNIEETSLEAEEVIKNYYKYFNEKNEEKVLSCLLFPPSSASSFRFFNLEYINLVDIKYISDEARYNNYINDFLTKNKKFDIEMLKIYEVTYDVKFIEEIEPVNSGEITKEVILVKLAGSDKWLIEAIGTM